MRFNIFKIAFVLAVMFLLSGILVPSAMSGSAKLMTKEELKKIMDSDTVSIIDVRKGRDWSQSEFKIKGADRLDMNYFTKDVEKYPRTQTLVLYCS